MVHKYLIFISKRPDTSRPEFADYLRNTLALRLHNTLSAQRLDNWNLTLPEETSRAMLLTEAPPIPFDAYLEGWIDGAGELAALAAELHAANSDAAAPIASERSCAVICEEHRTSQEELGDGADAPDDGSMLKQIILIGKKAGMSRDDFLAYYENGHARLAARTLRMWSGYQRNFVDPDLTRKLSFGTVGQFFPRLDVMTVLRYRNQSKLDEMNTVFKNPEIGKIMAEDEDKFIDRSSFQMLMVQENKMHLNAVR